MKTAMVSKKDKAIYWTATALVAVFELPSVLFVNSQAAIDGMNHLGLPDWFRWELSIAHSIGAILLVIPLPKRIKEWVYVAFGIDFTSAFIAYFSIDGLVANTFSPLVILALLIVSYVFYHKIEKQKARALPA